MTRIELLDALKSVYITSFSRFIIAHNLLLLAVRQRVIDWQEAQCLTGSRDYILEQMYLPVTKLDLSQEQKYIVSQVVRFAERVGFIRDGHATFVKVVAELRSEIRDTHLQLHVVLDDMSRMLYQLDHRVLALEQWTQDACEEFQKLCNSQQQIVRDLQNMSPSLNELQNQLQEQHWIGGIQTAISVFLNMIPIFSGGLCGAAFASSEIFPGMGVETLFSIADTCVSELLAVDLSNYRNLVSLTSKEFFCQLNPVVQKRLQYAVHHSGFQSLSNLNQQIEAMIAKLDEGEGSLASSIIEEAELLQRFNDLASLSHWGTIRVTDAIDELHHELEKQVGKGVKSETVQQAVMHQVNRKTGRLSFDSFLMALSELKKLHPDCKWKHVPVELHQRFRTAAEPGTELPTFVAKVVSKELFRESGGEHESGSCLSFKRTREEWNESEVEDLLRHHGRNGVTIEMEGFVEAGMKVLFAAKRVARGGRR